MMARLTFLLASTCLVGALAAPAWADPAGAQADNAAGQNAGAATDGAQSGNNELIVTGTRIVAEQQVGSTDSDRHRGGHQGAVPD